MTTSTDRRAAATAIASAVAIVVTALATILGAPATAQPAPPAASSTAGDQLVDVTTERRSPLCDFNDAWCGSITHYSPDQGMDAAFLVRCRFGDSTSNRWVYEGQSSTSVCASDEGVDQVYVGTGRKIVCLSTYGWITRYDDTGWAKIYDGQHPVCVHQYDSESAYKDITWGKDTSWGKLQIR